MPHPDSNGVHGLARELPALEPVAMPRRPDLNAWPPEVAAQMQAINAAADAFAREQGL